MFFEERVRDWLRDIIENSDRVASYLNGMDYDAFIVNGLTRDAVERCVERITEAAVRLGPERIAALAPGTALHQVRGLGNVLRHEYDRVDARLLWTAATIDLPLLRAACATALT